MTKKRTDVHGGGTTLRVDRLARTKSRAALALAVSLWIATGGVASAEETTVTVGSGETVQYVYNGEKSAKNPWATPRPTGEKTDYHTVINGGTATGRVLGGFSNDSNANNNTVTVTNVTITADVVDGGYSGSGGTGNANNNIVTLTDTIVDRGDTYGSNVTGGSSYAGDATGNSVTLIRSTVSNDVIGGSVNDYHTATGNTVSLTDSKVWGYVYGGFGGTGNILTGNTLNLSGENTAGAVANFGIVNLESATWGKTVLTAEDFTNITNIDASGLAFTNPGAASGSTTLLSATSGLDTPTLTVTSHTQTYTNSPLVAGVTIDGTLTGNIMQNASVVTYTLASNTVNKIAFGDVAWKDSGALYTRPDDVSFNNAAVDTSNINFTNIKSLAANKTMTLVSGWDGTVGDITGTKYKVGSTLEGEGKASLVGTDLIFTAETAVESLTVQEQTHNTVMGAEVGMAALAAGNDFIGAATDGLSLASNIGADGISSFAKMGGGSMRQETGSHVDVHTWNAILALGHANKKERGTFEYGAFFEYGNGNYTTHNGAERGDGSARYTGGGAMAKWAANHGLYVEGSLRAGSVHDDAHDVLRDVNGTPYSYETNAPYWGLHVGVGKEITLADGNTLDVYGKFYHNHRNGVSFNAGGHYDLDAVNSDVLRIGARYMMKREKWNFYGGLAYEHELSGKAEGRADGVAIRGADTSGASLRAEIGATMTPDENSPWKLDLNLAGFAGKKEGVTGGVSVAWMF